MALKRGIRSDRQSCTVGARRCGALAVGAGAAVGAFFVSGIASSVMAPPAHADFEDVVVQPIIDAIDHAVSLVDPGLLSASVDPSIALDGLTAPALAAASSSASVPDVVYLPLQMDGVTPLMDVSAGGGTTVPAVFDTGSNGLVLPSQDLPWWLVGLSMLNPSDYVIGGFAGTAHSLEYLGVEVPTTVTLGDASTGQLVTGQTEVTAVLSSGYGSQNWWQEALGIYPHPESMQQFFGGEGAGGVLGVGPNASGPQYLWSGSHFPGTLVTAALPGDLKDGEFIMLNRGSDWLPGANSVVGFGPVSALDIGGPASSPAPTTEVLVGINGGTPTQVQAIFDSGAQTGTIPAHLIGNATSVPNGTEISVYNLQDQLLYQYTTGTTNDYANDIFYSPSVGGSEMNTGIAPFEFGGQGDQSDYQGIYISNSPSGGMLQVP